MSDYVEEDVRVDVNEGSPVVGLEKESRDYRLPTDEPSVVDLLRQDFEELTSVVDVTIPIQGYEKTGLAVKYHLPENGKQTANIADKVMREVKDRYTRNLLIGIDLMIFLCEGLYVKPAYSDVPDYVMLDPDETGVAVQFDERLAAILKASEISDARSVVKKLFNNNDAAILAHAEKLNRWLQNTKADLSIEFWATSGEG